MKYYKKNGMEVEHNMANFDMKFNYGYIVVEKEKTSEGLQNIVHFCGYEKKPTFSDYEHLLEELQSDEEFGKLDMSKYEIKMADEDICKEYTEMLKELKAQQENK